MEDLIVQYLQIISNMGNPTLIQKYILWPLQEWRGNRRRRIFREILRENGLDFGKYYMSEIIEMYHRHKDEIKYD